MKKTLAIIVIIILLVGCGVLGYFTYNLNEDNTKYHNETKDYKTQLQELQKKLEALKTENEQIKNSTIESENTSNDNNGYIDAVYSIPTVNYTSTVVLFKSGKCVFTSHMEYNLCEYDINGDKLNLHFKGNMLYGDGTPYTKTYNILKHDTMEFIKIADGSDNDELKRLQ